MIKPDAVSLGAGPPDDINVIVTAALGGEPFSVRVDEASGAMTVSQLYQSTMRVPGNLGIVPHTLNENAEPVETLVLTSHVLTPGMVIAVRPIGVVYVSDDAGDGATVLSVPVSRLTKRYDHVSNYTDLPAVQLRQIAHFFCHYKDLEEHRPGRSAGWGDVDEARRVITEAVARKRQPVTVSDR